MEFIERNVNNYLESERSRLCADTYTSEKRLDNLIVSLTSFPARIDNVWKTILSLKRQSWLPSKIILWLSLEEFPNREIPQSLSSMIDHLFNVEFVDRNLRSHKKYLYAFNAYPESAIVTVDDDVFYHKDVVKNLVETSLQYPGAVIANRVRQIKWDGDRLLPYEQWVKRGFFDKDWGYPADASDLFPVGVDGVLYPPGALDRQVCNVDLFMELTPMADDIWLNAMTRRNKTRVIYTGWKYRQIPVRSEGAPCLEDVNCGGNLNDIQFQKVRDYFKEKYASDIYAGPADS